MSCEMSGAMEMNEILKMLPHRFPFLLVDRVTSCVPGTSITGSKLVTRGEFGSIASMPRMLVLESLAQVAVLLTFRSLNVTPSGKELMFFAGIDSATFSTDAKVGDHVLLTAQVKRLMPSKGIGKFRTQASVNGIEVVHAEMMAAMRF